MILSCYLDDPVAELEPLFDHRGFACDKRVFLSVGLVLVGLLDHQIDDLIGIRCGQLERTLQLYRLPVIMLAIGQSPLAHLRAHQTTIEEEDLGTVFPPCGKVLCIELGGASKVTLLL